MRDGQTFAVDGREFRLTVERDDYQDPPWEQEDGHGPVSEWRPAESKGPGELILIRDRGRARFYDFAEAVKIAKRDGWGVRGDEALTGGAKAAYAARKDFERLASWCNDGWCYVVVTVTLLDEEGEPTEDREVLGGVESDCKEYLDQVAREMAEDIIHNLQPLAGWRV